MPGSVFQSSAVFELMTTSQPTAVMNNGTPLPQLANVGAVRGGGTGWSWDGATGSLWIGVPGASSITISP